MKTLTKLLLFGLVLLPFSCTEKDVEPDVFSEEVQKMVPQNVVDELRSWGMTIHSGITPPNIEGIYQLYNRELARYWDPGITKYNGQQVVPSRLMFTNQSTDNKSVTYEMKKVGEAKTFRYGNGLVSGSGNKFTFFEEEVYGNSAGVYLRILNVISGEITDSGIKDYHEISQYIKLKTSEAPSHVTQEEGQGLFYRNQSGKISAESTTF